MTRGSWSTLCAAAVSFDLWANAACAGEKDTPPPQAPKTPNRHFLIPMPLAKWPWRADRRVEPDGVVIGNTKYSIRIIPVNPDAFPMPRVPVPEYFHDPKPMPWHFKWANPPVPESDRLERKPHPK